MWKRRRNESSNAGPNLPSASASSPQRRSRTDGWRTVASIMDDMWSECYEQQRANNAHALKFAERLRALVQELGAKPSEQRPGEWELECPHCLRTLYLRED